MKLNGTKSLTNSILAIAGAAAVLFYYSSCARKIAFQSSPAVPAARGDVKVKKDNNNNYSIQISLNDLAEPKRLTHSKSTYVVWMESADNVTKNIGQINSSTGFLSSKLKASFETVSSTKPTKIFLTAEDDAGIQFPGMQLILTTNDL
jgi:hypothetical protein